MVGRREGSSVDDKANGKTKASGSGFLNSEDGGRVGWQMDAVEWGEGAEE